jgi:hypothetical protein
MTNPTAPGDIQIMDAMNASANAYVTTGETGRDITLKNRLATEAVTERIRAAHADGFLVGQDWLRRHGSYITTDAVRSIQSERQNQRVKGYDADHDRTHSAGQWYIILSGLLCSFGIAVMQCDQRSAWRASLVKLAATAQAAIEAIDTP